VQVSDCMWTCFKISYKYRNNKVLYERLHIQTVCGWKCVQLCRMAGFSIDGK
jgi:hypothetical protein